MNIKNQPIILQDGVYTKNDIEALKSRVPVWRISDIYKNQLEELFEINNADIRLSKDYRKKRDEYIKKRTAKTNAGNWVYFPWSGVLVRMVGDEEYYVLRTNRNRNFITMEEQAILREFNPAVVGLSVGGSIAMSLVYSAIGRCVKLAEYDSLETTNLNRVRARVDQVGMPKLDIIQQQIYEINPYEQLVCFWKGLSNKNVKDFVRGEVIPSIIFEEIDNFEMKIIIRLLAREAGIPVVSFANIGDSMVIDIERFDLDQNAPLFNGLAGNTPEEILKKPDVTDEDKNRYAVKLVGKDLVPKRGLESLKEINKTLVGRPQLIGTITASSGFAPYIARRIALGDPMLCGRIVVKFDDIIK